MTGDRLRLLDELLVEFFGIAARHVKDHVAALRAAVADALDATEGGDAS